VRGFWQDLYSAGADIVVNGHEHNYQRYAKQDPSGRASARGIRQFIVGTGGRSLYALREEKLRNFQAGTARHFGVLRLALGERSYSWEFVGIDGSVLDRGGPTLCN
jgi:acid phosphatase type 7